MRPCRLFLHVGLPKTATTAWQAWWDAHRDILRTQGVDYPGVRSINFGRNHTALSKQMRARDLSGFFGVLEAGQADTMLISSESFSLDAATLPVPLMQAFRRETKDIDLTLLLTTRCKHDWIAAMHKQLLVNNPGGQKGAGFTANLAQTAALPRVAALLDHDAVVATLERQFGGRCLRFAHEDSPFELVCRAIGIDPSRLPAPDRIHGSISSSVAALLVQVNGLAVHPDVRAACVWLLQQAEPSTHNGMLQTARPVAARWSQVLAALSVLTADDDDVAEVLFKIRDLANAELQREP